MTHTRVPLRVAIANPLLIRGYVPVYTAVYGRSLLLVVVGGGFEKDVVTRIKMTNVSVSYCYKWSGLALQKRRPSNV